VPELLIVDRFVWIKRTTNFDLLAIGSVSLTGGAANAQFAKLEASVSNGTDSVKAVNLRLNSYHRGHPRGHTHLRWIGLFKGVEKQSTYKMTATITYRGAATVKPNPMDVPPTAHTLGFPFIPTFAWPETSSYPLDPSEYAIFSVGGATDSAVVLRCDGNLADSYDWDEGYSVWWGDIYGLGASPGSHTVTATNADPTPGTVTVTV
jgi:hypothetical protein